MNVGFHGPVKLNLCLGFASNCGRKPLIQWISRPVDFYHDSLHLSSGSDKFLKLGVAKWPGLTAICHYCTGIIDSLNAFLFGPFGTILSYMVFSNLQNSLHSCTILLFISCTWSWSLVTICPRETYLYRTSLKSSFHGQSHHPYWHTCYTLL